MACAAAWQHCGWARVTLLHLAQGTEFLESGYIVISQKGFLLFPISIHLQIFPCTVGGSKEMTKKRKKETKRRWTSANGIRMRNWIRFSFDGRVFSFLETKMWTIVDTCNPDRWDAMGPRATILRRSRAPSPRLRFVSLRPCHLFLLSFHSRSTLLWIFRSSPQPGHTKPQLSRHARHVTSVGAASRRSSPSSIIFALAGSYF